MTDNMHWTEVDQVTLVWTEAPGPLRAGLLFRTGRVDETVLTAGYTHLIEHLALSALGAISRQQNGFVGGVLTGFYTVGQPAEVSDFLTRICTALTALPGDRLVNEKKVLEAENARHSGNFQTNLLTWRYGAANYGLLGMPEFGLERATLEQIQQFAAQRFTTGNAILWLSGPPPADLRLPLPPGPKQAQPPLTSIQPRTPGWFLDNACGGVAAAATVARVFAAPLFCEIATQRLQKQLRLTQAVSYAPAIFYEPLNADTAHLILYADSDPNRRAELAQGFGEVFQGLTEFEATELETARQHILEAWSGALGPPPAERPFIEMQRAVMDWLMGAVFDPMETNIAQLQSVSVSDLVAFGREVHKTALFALPSGTKLQPCFGQKLPFSTTLAVTGRHILLRDAPIYRDALVSTPEGVSVSLPDGAHCTVRYATLAAALCYADGGVRLIGQDAATLMVEPTLWRDGPRLCADIRERIPAHLRFDRPARPAAHLPKPSTTFWQRLRARFNQR